MSVNPQATERPSVCPVTGAPAAIVYLGVRKSFGEHHVLRGLNLVVPRGKITVVIGRSGTGKSVTIKHVMGLLRPDAGRIWVGDDELTAMDDAALRKVRTRFGIVFQHAALFDSMDVFENIAFPLREHERMAEAQIRARVMDLLAQVGLRGADRKFPSELSGGMAKRVGLARALVREPEFLLYDEPTTGLDPIMTDVINELILRVRARPRVTSVVVTHDMNTARKVADRVIMLYPLFRLKPGEPQIVFDGTVADLDRSRDPRIRQFIEGRAGDRLMELREEQARAAAEDAATDRVEAAEDDA